MLGELLKSLLTVGLGSQLEVTPMGVRIYDGSRRRQLRDPYAFRVNIVPCSDGSVEVRFRLEPEDAGDSVAAVLREANGGELDNDRRARRPKELPC